MKKGGGKVTIAVDGMGGDYAPQEIVFGVADAVRQDLRVILTGPSREIGTCYLKLPDKQVIKFIKVVNTTQVIGFDDKASIVRHRVDSSLVRAVDQVASGDADGVVSAGNTGAVAMAAIMRLKSIKGVRPGLLSILPTPNKPTLFMDVGGNAENKPEHLHDFAKMATIFATDIMDIPNPSVGLLSIGEEAVKGNSLVLGAYDLLEDDYFINFYGNIEGRDIVRNAVDIVVTDGFTGNVCLKLMESTSSLIIEEVKKAARKSTSAKIGGMLLKPQLQEFKESIDSETFGGAYLLGVNGLVVICHGNSSRKVIANAIRYAEKAAREGLVRKLQRALAK